MIGSAAAGTRFGKRIDLIFRIVYPIATVAFGTFFIFCVIKTPNGYMKDEDEVKVIIVRE